MAMLRWIYTDELELREDDIFLTELMKLANKFQLQLLRERWVLVNTVVILELFNLVWIEISWQLLAVGCSFAFLKDLRFLVMQQDIQLITGNEVLHYSYAVAVFPYSCYVYFPVLLPVKLITLICQWEEVESNILITSSGELQERKSQWQYLVILKGHRWKL